MSLVTISDLSIGYRGPPLLDGVCCRIERGERIGLLGRNGAGKSTLLRILCDQVEPDHGEVIAAPGAKVALLPQDMPTDLSGVVRDVVAAGLPAPQVTDDTESPWLVEQQVNRTLSRMQLDGDAQFDVLSAGMKRRVLLARALVNDPDLLLLDEPTNHLDIEAIDWLEQLLARWPASAMFVTHDRMFLRRLATRILELDRGQLFDWTCDYDTFLKRKEAALAAQEKQDALFDKRLAQEEAWIRQGIKARRTRNEGRVKELKRMRQARQQRTAAEGTARMQLHQELRSGNIVAHVDQVSFGYGSELIIRDFSTTILRGDKIGIVGPNGVGKTTLLRLLLGELPPAQGSIRLGTNLQVAYFDQTREQLDPDKTVQENVGDGYDSVRVGGKTKHIVGYLQEFLFAPERARTLVRFISGGERNRALLARLMAKSANVVVLDEPTNDLDMETLELLEELLVEYKGTVLLVSHDRAFLNNVVTSTIVFENGQLKEYVGGYDDWLRQRTASAAQASDAAPPNSRTKASQSPQTKNRPPDERPQRAKRLSFKEQQELAALPARIEQLEEALADMHQQMADPEFYKQPGSEISRQTAAAQQLEAQLHDAYHRWEELDQRS